MTGVADLVAALTGGDKLEQDAYSQAATRIAQAQASQALMDERVQKAYALKRENQKKEFLPKLISSILSDPERTPNSPLTDNQNAALMGAFLEAGYTGADSASAIEGMIENALRQQAYLGAGDQGFTPFNQAAATFQMKPVDTLTKVGDLVVRDNLTSNPLVDAVMTAQNSIAGANADKAGVAKGKDAEIQYYVNVLGMSMEDAVKKAYGRKRIQMDELGNVVSIDDTAPLDNAVISVPITGATTGQPIPAPKPGDTLYEMASDATGPGNYAVGAAGRVADLIPGVDLPEWAQPTVEAQAKFKSNMRTLVRSLSETRAFREQEYILSELSTMPALLKGEGTLQTQIDSLRDVLQRMLAQEERDSQDPAVGRESQKLAQANASKIRNFLPVLGGSNQSSAAEITPQMRSEAEAALMDVPGFVDDLSPDEQERLIRVWIEQQGGR